MVIFSLLRVHRKSQQILKSSWFINNQFQSQRIICFMRFLPGCFFMRYSVHYIVRIFYNEIFDYWNWFNLVLFIKDEQGSKILMSINFIVCFCFSVLLIVNCLNNFVCIENIQGILQILPPTHSINHKF